VPSSKQRRENIRRELAQIHKGGGTFLFGYSATIGGQAKFIQICESAFFKALGTGKTTQWYAAMNAVKNVRSSTDKKGRSKFKFQKVVAFITLFLAKCEMPPSQGMQHIKILPFPNMSHFYQEYCSTFKAPYMALLSTEQAMRFAPSFHPFISLALWADCSRLPKVLAVALWGAQCPLVHA
jgi:hypothetical protein